MRIGIGSGGNMTTFWGGQIKINHQSLAFGPDIVRDEKLISNCLFTNDICTYCRSCDDVYWSARIGVRFIIAAIVNLDNTKQTYND